MKKLLFLFALLPLFSSAQDAWSGKFMEGDSIRLLTLGYYNSDFPGTILYFRNSETSGLVRGKVLFYDDSLRNFKSRILPFGFSPAQLKSAPAKGMLAAGIMKGSDNRYQQSQLFEFDSLLNISSQFSFRANELGHLYTHATVRSEVGYLFAGSISDTTKFLQRSAFVGFTPTGNILRSFYVDLEANNTQQLRHGNDSSTYLLQTTDSKIPGVYNTFIVHKLKADLSTAWLQEYQIQPTIPGLVTLSTSDFLIEDNGILSIIGHGYNYGNATYFMFFLQLNPNGSFVNGRYFNSWNGRLPLSATLHKIDSGQYLISAAISCPVTGNGNGCIDVPLIIKTDSSGTLIDSYSLAANSNDRLTMQCSKDGKYATAFRSYQSGSPLGEVGILIDHFPTDFSNMCGASPGIVSQTTMSSGNVTITDASQYIQPLSVTVTETTIPFYYYSDSILIRTNCITSGINELTPETSVNIYPQPANQSLTLETDLSGTLTGRIYNSIGQLQLLIPGFHEKIVVQTDKLAAGVYVLEINSESGRVSKKIMID